MASTVTKKSTISKKTGENLSYARHVPSTWINVWFLVSSLVVCWDIGYILYRPRSMTGGDLHWIWEPYSHYEKVDYSLDRKDGFPAAQTYLNIMETILNFVYLYLATVSKSPVSVLIGFTAVVMTLSKTLLYWLQEYACDFCATGQNSTYDFITLWVIPNGLWIVFPAIITHIFGSDIARTLRFAAKEKEL